MSSAKSWLFRRDLEREVPGRPDSKDLIADCIQFFETGEHPIVSVAPHKTEQRTKAVLAAAHLRASTGRSYREVQLEQRLAAANSAIDRLLAFVPTRAPAISPIRLGTIVDSLSRESARLFPGAISLAATVLDEPEVDTRACHRVTFRIAVPPSFPAPDFAERSAKMHDALARLTSEEEYQAIRLVVEPAILE